MTNYGRRKFIKGLFLATPGLSLLTPYMSYSQEDSTKITLLYDTSMLILPEKKDLINLALRVIRKKNKYSDEPSSVWEEPEISIRTKIAEKFKKIYIDYTKGKNLRDNNDISDSDRLKISNVQYHFYQGLAKDLEEIKKYAQKFNINVEKLEDNEPYLYQFFLSPEFRSPFEKTFNK